MPRGGAREGAGRKAGQKSRKTVQREQQVQAIEASGLTPLEYLLGAMRDQKATAHERRDAAKAAAPYIHPSISNIALTTRSLDEMTPEEVFEFRDLLKAFIAEREANPEGAGADSAEAGDTEPSGELLN